jgi:hypothetical protein
MDSEDFGGLFRRDLIHLKPLNSTVRSILALSRDKRLDELFNYLVLRLEGSLNRLRDRTLG